MNREHIAKLIADENEFKSPFDTFLYPAGIKGSFGDEGMQKNLLKQIDRLRWFQKSFKDIVKPGMTVIDLGAGSGILGKFALDAGAQEVIFIEMAPTALFLDTVTNLRKQFPDREITVICKPSFEINENDIPHKADVIISETVGFLALNEGWQQIVKPFKERFLKPSGHCIPEEIGLKLWAISTRDFYKHILQRWVPEPCLVNEAFKIPGDMNRWMGQISYTFIKYHRSGAVNEMFKLLTTSQIGHEIGKFSYGLQGAEGKEQEIQFAVPDDICIGRKVFAYPGTTHDETTTEYRGRSANDYSLTILTMPFLLSGQNRYLSPAGWQMAGFIMPFSNVKPHYVRISSSQGTSDSGASIEQSFNFQQLDEREEGITRLTYRQRQFLLTDESWAQCSIHSAPAKKLLASVSRSTQRHAKAHTRATPPSCDI